MKRVLCARLPRPGHPELLSEKEAEHVVRVLRLRPGDEIEALDGEGHAARVTLRIYEGKPGLEFLRPAETVASAVPLTLEMAILKGDAMEWVVEKAVELGASSLVPLITAHTVVQIKGKGPEAFRERWQKIADQALKQCGRQTRLVIELPEALSDRLTKSHSTAAGPRLWCDEAGRGETQGAVDLALFLRTHEADLGLRSLQLLVGPEGGWSDLERQLLSSDAQKVSLGPWVLRGETAALYAMSLVVSSLRQKVDKNGQI